MATQVQKRPALLTPRFRVAFPQIIQPKVFQEGQKPRYSCVALFTPADFTDKEKEKWKELLASCNKVALDNFKKPMRDLDRASYKVPFHRGEEKDQYAGFGAGVVFFTMSAYTRRPGLVNNQNQPLEPTELYPGCYARASVNPFVNTKWKAIAIGMNNIQKLQEGERLDGATSAEEDFGSDASEYMDDDGLGVGTDPSGDFG